MTKQVNYFRDGKFIIPVNNGNRGAPQDCKSINSAKRRSRQLQSEGNIVRKV